MKLYIIRHGQSEDNVAMRQAGDSRLTSLGRQQAEATAEALRDTPIDRLYASPTRRTVETACIIGNALGLPPVLRADICERGRLFDEPGLTAGELRELCSNVQLGSDFAPDRGWAADFDGETPDEMYVRAVSVVQSLRQEHPNGTGSVAMVTHAYFSGYLMSVALGFTREQVQTNWLRMYNCGISHLEFKDHATMLWYLNSHAHVGELMTA
ncbi:MAG: histidine phosphatase family protein [Spirochaetaceae bacterium]|nr:MAG: histidine phosphatase family protein [Spirochaetaceae bacterium]